MKTKQDFKWRIMLQLNMADCSDNIWASCFQVRDLVSILVSSVVEMIALLVMGLSSNLF